jgi:hypothetical protein
MRDKESEPWDRRKEDAELREQTLRTLGAVQESIRLFERAINEHKVETENKFESLTETVNDHNKVLNGSAEYDGLNQQLREMRRAITLLMTGVLGEGGNHEKSLKGQVEVANKRLDLIQGEQIGLKIALESLEANKRNRITLRGQNFIVIAALCTMLATITAATINAYKDSIKFVASSAWGWVAHKGNTTVIPTRWIRPADMPKRKKARKKIPRPASAEEIPETACA